MTSGLPLVMQCGGTLPKRFWPVVHKVCNVVLYDEVFPTSGKTKINLNDIQGILTWGGRVKLTDSFLSKLPSLKVISSVSVGVDHIDLEATKRRNIFVGHTPNVLDDACADMALALLLSSARDVVTGDVIARDYVGSSFADEDSHVNYYGREVAGATLGIVGMGRIGFKIAQRANGIGMKVLYYNRSRRSEADEKEVNALYTPFNTLLAESDFVVLSAPLTPHSRHMMGSKQFSLMKKSSTVINIARGGLIDHDALVKALNDGVIGFAALDVTEPEPLPPNHPLRFMKRNVILTPHTGSATVTARMAMIHLAVENLVRGLSGKVPKSSPYPKKSAL